jgi:transketolase
MDFNKFDFRDAFFEGLYALAKKDKDIYLLTADFGAPSLDKFRKDLKKQFINVGICEQSMVNVSAGLALSGKKAYCYALMPFVTLRCYEQIKVDLCIMNLPVTIIAVGAGYGYASAGPTHHALEDIAIMRALPNMTILSPSDAIMAHAFSGFSYKMKGPLYIRLERGKSSQIYRKRLPDISKGFNLIKNGSDLLLLATGTMVERALEVSRELESRSIKAGVIDLYRIKPVDRESLLAVFKKTKRLVTIEEQILNGGIGSLISEILIDSGSKKLLKRIAIADDVCFAHGDRKYLQTRCGLDLVSATKVILEWVKNN